jgi:hypothetical protein
MQMIRNSLLFLAEKPGQYCESALAMERIALPGKVSREAFLNMCYNHQKAYISHLRETLYEIAQMRSRFAFSSS